MALHLVTFIYLYIKFHAWNFLAFKQENYIFMHENAPGMYFAPEMFMGSWAVQNFMHGIFTYENIRAKFRFLCMNISCSSMKVSFYPWENEIFMHEMKFSCLQLFVRLIFFLVDRLKSDQKPILVRAEFRRERSWFASIPDARK